MRSTRERRDCVASLLAMHIGTGMNYLRWTRWRHAVTEAVAGLCHLPVHFSSSAVECTSDFDDIPIRLHPKDCRFDVYAASRA